MSFIQSIKPGVSRRNLLFIAGIVWTFAGGMLLFRGISFFYKSHHLLSLKMLFSIIGGALFYFLLLSKISLKHTRRIIDLKIEKPCMFSFINIRSYILMAIMITTGILLRKSGIIMPENLSILFITMGMPLLLSAIRFFYYGICYH